MYSLKILRNFLRLLITKVIKKFVADKHDQKFAIVEKYTVETLTLFYSTLWGLVLVHRGPVINYM